MNPNIPVAMIMTEMPMVVKPTDNLKEVEQIFNHFDFHHIPVVEAGSKVVGIVSKTDWMKYLKHLSSQTTGKYFTEMSTANTQAKEIMTTHPTTLEPEDTVGLAADIFSANRFHALPIVDGDKLVGILTVHDLLNYAFKGVIAGEE